MNPLDDYPLAHDPPVETARGEPRRGWGIVVVLLLVLVGAVSLIIWQRTTRTAPGRAVSAASAPAATSRAPLGAAVDPVEIPPLDGSDPFVRDLVGRLSSRAEVVAWLATDGLIRNFVVSVDNIATGASPARHLSVLAPGSTFVAATRGGRLTVDDRSYTRYAGLAETVASLDPAGLARAYSTLKPRLSEAYRDLGHPDGNIDAAIEAAIVRLLATPVPPGVVVLTQGVVSYRYENEAYEDLLPAQKQLFRMGPDNVRKIQGQLWAVARELGIPSDRLPAPGTP